MTNDIEVVICPECLELKRLFSLELFDLDE